MNVPVGMAKADLAAIFAHFGTITNVSVGKPQTPAPGAAAATVTFAHVDFATPAERESAVKAGSVEHDGVTFRIKPGRPKPGPGGAGGGGGGGGGRSDALASSSPRDARSPRPPRPERSAEKAATVDV